MKTVSSESKKNRSDCFEILHVLFSLKQLLVLNLEVLTSKVRQIVIEIYKLQDKQWSFLERVGSVMNSSPKLEGALFVGSLRRALFVCNFSDLQS